MVSSVGAQRGKRDTHPPNETICASYQNRLASERFRELTNVLWLRWLRRDVVYGKRMTVVRMRWERLGIIIRTKRHSNDPKC
jgi:hypothetical protein